MINTLQAVYADIKEKLRLGGIEFYEFEARCLLENIGYKKETVLTYPDKKISDKMFIELKKKVERRISGEPLQYILGKWDFCDYSFFVGNGVHIPRAETEKIVEIADEFLHDKEKSVVYDLCAGTGALGLTLAGHNENIDCYLFEKYNEAIGYIKKNNDNFNLKNTHIIKADVFESLNEKIPKADLIVCNPPYIPRSEVKTLQKEVLFEPLQSLDGGVSGLDFYFAVKENWLLKLNENGRIIFECGNNQAKDIINIFKDKSSESKIIYDFSEVDRTVILDF
ncbi:MAG: peptide chain release factor N(5)-glutamine methyltransferase [Candidatus Fimenecus sp.]